jgi:hypothetical protein
VSSSTASREQAIQLEQLARQIVREDRLERAKLKTTAGEIADHIRKGACPS